MSLIPSSEMIFFFFLTFGNNLFQFCFVLFHPWSNAQKPTPQSRFQKFHNMFSSLFSVFRQFWKWLHLSHTHSSVQFSRSAAAAKSLQSCPALWPHRQQPTRLPRPWDSPGENTGVGCHVLLQCMKVKSEREVTQSCLTLCDPWTAAYQAPLSNL